MQLDIKEVLVSEIETLRRIGVQSYKDHFTAIWTPKGLNEYLHTQFNSEKLETDLKGDKVKYFLVEYEEAYIGFFKMNLNKCLPNSNVDRGLELEKIYLLQSFIGKGLGKKMIDFIIDFGKREAAPFIWLDALKNNVKAKKFYEQNGFIVVDEIDFSTDKMKIDMWVMKYDLAS